MEMMCITLIVCMFAIRLFYRFDSIGIRAEKVLKQIDAVFQTNEHIYDMLSKGVK